MRQQSAREAGVAIDSLELVTSWDAAKSASVPGAFVDGLRLQGAVFDGRSLRDTAADAAPFARLPVARLSWLVPGHPSASGPSGGGNEPPMRVPLYLTPEREKAIAELQFPVYDSEESARWILAGVAVTLA